jgi:hypothetical protein
MPITMTSSVTRYLPLRSGLSEHQIWSRRSSLRRGPFETNFDARTTGLVALTQGAVSVTLWVYRPMHEIRDMSLCPANKSTMSHQPAQLMRKFHLSSPSRT